MKVAVILTHIWAGMLKIDSCYFELIDLFAM